MINYQYVNEFALVDKFMWPDGPIVMPPRRCNNHFHVKTTSKQQDGHRLSLL